MGVCSYYSIKLHGVEVFLYFCIICNLNVRFLSLYIHTCVVAYLFSTIIVYCFLYRTCMWGLTRTHTHVCLYVNSIEIDVFVHLFDISNVFELLYCSIITIYDIHTSLTSCKNEMKKKKKNTNKKLK